MEITHTPGPWIVGKLRRDDDPNEPDMAYLSIGIRTGQTICEAWLLNSSEDELAANARLIAAAPDLYVALTNLVATTRTFRNVPKDKQEWTPLDDEALNEAFEVLTKVQP